MTTTIDVAIPCYRYGNFLKQCVESVLSQQGVIVRILILDDCSPDNTAEVGTELARLNSNVEFRRHSQNKGHIATYNEGIEWASADLFLLLSADDYLLPGSLKRAAELMKFSPRMSFVFGDARMLLEDGSSLPCGPFTKISHADVSVLSCLEFVRVMNGRNIVPTPTAVVRTTAQKRVGGYLADLPHSGDMAMWLRLAAEGDVGFVNSRQAIYRMHSGNMSRSYIPSRLPDVLQRIAAVEHFLEHAGSDRELLRKALLSAIARDAMSLASASFNEGERVVSNQLSRVAQECYPRIRYTSPWARYQIKRFIGRRVWRALQSTYRNFERIRS